VATETELHRSISGTERSTTEESTRRTRRKYIGARGLGVKYVFDAGPDVDPLGPDNRLAFMTGPSRGPRP